MSQMSDLEADAEATRARLHETIGRIQDKLTVAGMVDEFIGQSAATPKLMGGQDMMLGFLRRNPLPVMIAAAGVGFLIHRMNKRRGRVAAYDEDTAVPAALNAGHARVYDPDLPSRHPLADGADPKRIEA